MGSWKTGSHQTGRTARTRHIRPLSSLPAVPGGFTILRKKLPYCSEIELNNGPQAQVAGTAPLKQKWLYQLDFGSGDFAAVPTYLKTTTPIQIISLYCASN
jgi:hypothetical protein